MIIWTKEFETGSANLDLQHRLLIDNINNLGNHLENLSPTPEAREFAAYLVDYLETYANMHFMIEEKCMESHRCPAHEENRQQHEKLRAYLQNYRKRAKAEGFKVEQLQDLHRVFLIWVREHILKIDTQLKPCIQQERGPADLAALNGDEPTAGPD